MANLQSLTINDTGSLTLPTGTVANRPTTTSTVVNFTATGSTTWTVPANVTKVDVLVVAGGGGGGSEHGGGGGGGGVIYKKDYPVTPGAVLTVVVGAGGAGGAYSATNGANNWGTNGSNSRFDTLTAIGGGGGAPYRNSSALNSAQGNAGGSGGGGGASNPGVATTASLNGLLNEGGAGTVGQGFKGGAGGFPINGNYTGGGGGGAGGAGGDAGGLLTLPSGQGNNERGSFGGPGVACDISGSVAYYGGGGGSSYYGSALSGPGGIGGGGASGNTGSYAGVNGTANTGGGGGGSYDNAGASAVGGTGGSGVVIVRYDLTASSASPTAQVRFNTNTKTVENYIANNKWKANPKSEGVITTGLVGYWDGAQYTSGTTWYDLSGNGNNITLTSGLASTYSSTDGSFTQTASTSEYAICNPFPHPTTTYTREIWINASASSSGEGILSYATTGADNSALIFGTTDINIYGPTGTSYSSGKSIAGKNWTHIAHTSNRLTGVEKLYINGELVRTATDLPGTLLATGGSLVIGHDQDTVGGTLDAAQALEGKFSIVRVYSRELSIDEVRRNFNAERGRFNRWPTMINTGAPSPGSSPASAARSAREIKEVTGTTNNDFYWISPQSGAGTYTTNGSYGGGYGALPLRLWCDMNYDGGGWVLVMCNYRAGAITGAPGTNGIGGINYYQAVNLVNYNGSVDKRLGFRCMVGVKFWPALGLNVAQFAATAPVPLSRTSSHTKRYRWAYTGMSNTYAFQGASAVGDDGSGAASPGMYSYHAANGYSLTTTELDQDASGSNCSNSYGGNPFWYGACWSGNMWGSGSSAGYQDAPYWDSSGTDYHNYMAVYLKV